ncbi:hypothetical protein CLF_113280, partial [Clonorchis sinensis]
VVEMFNVFGIFAEIISRLTEMISPAHSCVATRRFIVIDQCCAHICMRLVDQSVGLRRLQKTSLVLYALCASSRSSPWEVARYYHTMHTLQLSDSFSGYSVADSSGKMNRDSDKPIAYHAMRVSTPHLQDDATWLLPPNWSSLQSEVLVGFRVETSRLLVVAQYQWIRFLRVISCYKQGIRICTQAQSFPVDKLDEKTSSEYNMVLQSNWSLKNQEGFENRCTVSLVGQHSFVPVKNVPDQQLVKSTFTELAGSRAVRFCHTVAQIGYLVRRVACVLTIQHCYTRRIFGEETTHPRGHDFGIGKSLPRGNKTPESMKRHLPSRFLSYPIKAYVPTETSYSIRSGLLVISRTK